MLGRHRSPSSAVKASGEREGGLGAFIDLGTNSARMVLVRFEPGGGHSVISHVKEVVRLGEGEFFDHRLQPEAMRRATLVCRQFAEMARANGVDHIEAIATSATREAVNQREFLDLLEAESGLELRVISGREEARIIYLGVSSGLHLGERTALFIDIGGGSTELVVGSQREALLLDSMKLGAIRLSGLFFLPDESGPVSDERYALIKRYVQNAAVRSVQRIQSLSFDLAVGSSGSIENLADIVVRRFEGRPRERDDELTRSQLGTVVTELRALDLEARRQVPGINPARADIIVAGAAILETLMEELNIERLQISERGLREGLIADELMRRHPELYDAMDVRERSVVELGRSCGFDEAHAREVRRLCVDLFDSARDIGLMDLDDGDREILCHAAMLHDIGSMLSYSSHERHSHYLIGNADLLGFDRAAIAAIAAVARFHRRGFPSKKHPEYRALPAADRKRIRPLSVLLRLAESLDRSHGALVKRAAFVALDSAETTLEIDSASGDCHLEVWGALRQRESFHRAFGRRLQLRVDGQPATWVDPGVAGDPDDLEDDESD